MLQKVLTANNAICIKVKSLSCEALRAVEEGTKFLIEAEFSSAAAPSQCPLHNVKGQTLMDIIRKVQSSVNSMKRNSHRCAMGVLAAGLAISTGGAAALFGAQSPAIAALKCKPDLIVTNDRAAAIKVTKIQYEVLGQTHIDGITNKRLAPGETEEWRTVSLKDAAKGNVITNIRYEFKPDTSGVGSPIGDPWGSPQWSVWQGHAALCDTGLNYPHRIN
jgi:hypothetical protein